MAQPPAPAELATLPKVELHLHFGGTISEATALELASRHGVDPGSLPFVDGRYAARYGDFPTFLAAFIAANDVVRTPDDVELVARRLAEAQAAQHVAYTEVIVTGLTFVRNGIAPADLWASLTRGLAAGGSGTRFGIVVDAIRDFGRQEAEDTVRLVEEATVPVVGLCLTGIEGTEPWEEFRVLRDAADRMGKGFQVHAGETGPVSGVAKAIDILGADRIGHGVRAIEDEALLRRLVRERVPLDVCPSSNIGTGMYPSLEVHPLPALLDAGVEATVSSDDPPFFATTLTSELAAVAAIAGLDRAGLAELQRRAARVSFAPEETKRAVIAEIDAWAGA